MRRLQNVLLYLLLVCFLSWNLLVFFKGPESTPNQKLLDDIIDRLRSVENAQIAMKSQYENHEEKMRILIKVFRNRQHVTNSKDRPDANVISKEDISILNSEKEAIIPILLIACNRVTVRQSLDQLIKIRPSAKRFPIIVSQDCGHAPTAKVIQSYGSQVVHIQQPDLSEPQVPWSQRKWKGYYKVSRHYKWALNQVFHKFNYTAVIIVEDDLDLSPDFFEYFSSLYTILVKDPTLWCVSAWNDNGKEKLIQDDPELLYRTDFFPGLGWMLTKKLWAELGPKWPATFWDDWMRHPDQRKDRSCIRPEISRTHTFGKIGVSKGQFFDKHLKFIKLNNKFVPFTQKDLSYLKKENFDRQFSHKIYSLKAVSETDLHQNKIGKDQVVRIEYTEKKVFQAMAKRFGLMEDFKSGVPRTGINGIVPFMYNGHRVYLAPPKNWSGYNLKWN